MRGHLDRANAVETSHHPLGGRRNEVVPPENRPFRSLSVKGRRSVGSKRHYRYSQPMSAIG